MSNSLEIELIKTVKDLSVSEINVLYSASRITNRVFRIRTIKSMMDRHLSGTTVYSTIHKLSQSGLLTLINTNLDEEKLEISFTPLGRSICALVKQRYFDNDCFADKVQPKLF